MSETSPARLRATDHLRVLGVFVTAGCAAAALYPFPVSADPQARQWWWLFAAFVSALAWQIGLGIDTPKPRKVVRPVGTGRRLTGALVALAGAALWVWATRELYLDWNGAFDRAWLGWLSGTVLLAIGLDAASGYWDEASGLSLLPRILLAMAVVLIVAGAVRLANITTFPGPHGITQIEDLQFGKWGNDFLEGSRRRWEFIGHAWVSALSIKFGSANLASMRAGYAVVGTLTVGAVFLWIRWSAGWVAAIVGSAFMAVSSWDAIVSRTGFNPNVLTVGLVYLLLMGPARRGRPSAFAAMGMLCGYILWEYIAYRPIAVFALAGGAFYSLRDKDAGWMLRLGRPVLMVALIACMSLPLFGTRLKGRVMDEYLNGLNRARAVKSYYNESHGWRQVLDLRINRSYNTIGLLYFQGDRSPARNLGYRPLVDQVSAVLALVGFAFCLANPHVPIFGLFAAGFVLTMIGAMVITSDFNVLRMSVTIPYVYFFVGIAGASVLRVLGRAWGRFGLVFGVAVLLAGFGWATYSNLTFLRSYWSSPQVKKAVHSDLALVSGWLGRSVPPGDQVIGAGNRNNNALAGSDASWLRGRKIPGALEWDIGTALRKWHEDRPTTLVVFTGPDTADTQKFLEYSFPSLSMTFEEEPFRGAHLAYAHLDGIPENLTQVLENLDCRGVSVEYVYTDKAGKVVKRLKRVEPMVGLSTWATEAYLWVHRGIGAERIRVEYNADIRIRKGGRYEFHLKVYAGTAQITVDGRTYGGRKAIVSLKPGVHQLSAMADLKATSGGIESRLLWKGPDSAGKQELVPFYRIAVPLEGCKEEPENEAASAARSGGDGQRPVLTDADSGLVADQGGPEGTGHVLFAPFSSELRRGQVQRRRETPMTAENVTFLRDDGGVEVGVDARLEFFAIGNINPGQGTVSFVIEPDWDGSDETSHSFFVVGERNVWNNRMWLVKQGEHLRLMLFDDVGAERGLGGRIGDWVAGERHQVQAAWSSDRLALYIDGELVDERPNGGKIVLNGNSRIEVGSRYTDKHGGAAGRLFEFTIEDRMFEADGG